MRINSNTIKLEKESYEKVENIIKKIAADNNIENVEGVSIKLSSNQGIVSFKIKEAFLEGLLGAALGALGVAGAYKLNSWLTSQLGEGWSWGQAIDLIQDKFELSSPAQAVEKMKEIGGTGEQEPIGTATPSEAVPPGEGGLTEEEKIKFEQQYSPRVYEEGGEEEVPGTPSSAPLTEEEEYALKQRPGVT